MIKESNNFHACCLDTYPPLIYFTEKTVKIINLIHEKINSKNIFRCGYTIDAGANPFILTRKENLK